MNGQREVVRYHVGWWASELFWGVYLLGRQVQRVAQRLRRGW